MLFLKTSVFQRNFFPHPLLMTLFTTETNSRCPQKGLTEVDCTYVICDRSVHQPRSRDLFSQKRGYDPAHQELTQTDISNMDTCVCYFVGALIAATKCLHSPTPYASLSCAACETWVMWFEQRLSRLHALTVKAWEEAVQGQGNVFTSSNFHMSDYRK